MSILFVLKLTRGLFEAIVWPATLRDSTDPYINSLPQGLCISDLLCADFIERSEDMCGGLPCLAGSNIIDMFLV